MGPSTQAGRTMWREEGTQADAGVEDCVHSVRARLVEHELLPDGHRHIVVERYRPVARRAYLP